MTVSSKKDVIFPVQPVMLSITRDGDSAGLFRPVMSVSLRKNHGRQHGNRWGRVDCGNVRLSGTFINHHGYHGGHWWEFEQDNDWALLRHMVVPANPFISAVV